ncbi:Hypothetical predicted protein [Octopus vulgaris]|uniref:Uncharacterized protein n=1 Tax=Octopus vulgaris TaxID=6645 RepID=A0AA36BDY2_OCTVU|nr:Hypothetical predicted protein [Octopus vulgaris]
MENLLDTEALILPEEDATDNINNSKKTNIWGVYKKLERKKSLLGKVEKALETISNDLLNNNQNNNIFDQAVSSEIKYDLTKSDANIDNLYNLHEEYRKSEYNTKCLRDKLSEEISSLEGRLKKEIEKAIKIKEREELLKHRNGVLQEENTALQRSLEGLKMILKNMDEEKSIRNYGDKTEFFRKTQSDKSANALNMMTSAGCEKVENKTRYPYTNFIREEEPPSGKRVKNINVNDIGLFTVNNTYENTSKSARNYEKQYDIANECVMCNKDSEDLDELLSIFETFRSTTNNCCFCPARSCTPPKSGIIYSHTDDLPFTNSEYRFRNASRRRKKLTHQYQQLQIHNGKEEEDYILEDKKRMFSFGASFLIAIAIFISLYYRYTNY